MATYAQPAWTQAHVEARATTPRVDVLAEWDAIVPAMQRVLRDPTAYGLDESFEHLPVIDLLAHEHDLRETLGMDGFAEPSVWDAVSTRRRTVLEVGHTMGALPALEVRTPQGDQWTFGVGEGVVVVADRYELWRSLEGRRPRSAARAFTWSADPEPFLDHWTGFVFEWPAEPTT